MDVGDCYEDTSSFSSSYLGNEADRDRGGKLQRHLDMRSLFSSSSLLSSFEFVPSDFSVVLALRVLITALTANGKRLSSVSRTSLREDVPMSSENL